MQRDSGNHGDDTDEEDIDILLEDHNEEGNPPETDEKEVVTGCALVKLTLPKPTAQLVQLLYFRLHDIVSNSADYPPAQHYVRSVATVMGRPTLLGLTNFMTPLHCVK